MTTPKILVFVQSTLRTSHPSGVHRVAVELARNLVSRADVDFVKWDYVDGQLRYIDVWDLDCFFSGIRPDGTEVSPFAHRVAYRFGDTLSGDRLNILLFPEISYHSTEGNEVFARSITQARSYGCRTAAIFYDLIPISNSTYHVYRKEHLRYVVELARCDAIFPISVYSGQQLVSFFQDTLSREKLCLETTTQVLPVPLIEKQALPQTTGQCSNGAEKNTIIFVGTVEPRKKQVETLRALNDLAAIYPEVAAFKVAVFGALHPDVSVAFRREIGRNPHIEYYGYATEWQISQAYDGAAFSVFASNDEGYGLPIAESITRGVPCLCADFGSMAEIASGGGCLAVNVNDLEALKAAILKLIQDGPLRQRLREQIDRRPVRDWSDYARDIVEHLARLALPSRKPGTISLIDDGARAAASFDPAEGDEDPCATVVIEPNANAGQLSETCAAYLETLARNSRLEPFCAVFPGGAEALHALPDKVLNGAAEATAWGFSSETAYKEFAQRCRGVSPGLLPSRVAVDADSGRVVRELHDLVTKFRKAHRRRSSIANAERCFATAARHHARELVDASHLLSIVISTFNRGPFVTRNVEWLLSLLPAYKGQVRLIVVDNASTDNTLASLTRFQGAPFFELHRNTVNVGMLGNLRVCSSLMRTRHVWVIGDDDFIVADAIARVLDVLRAEPGTPMVISNFGVYHRERLGDGDTAAVLIRECTPLCRKPAPTGRYPLNRIAEQHDNLFTAVYPIVWRSDILAACFNYPFDGIPFGNLVESVPTTKIILDDFGFTEAYWLADIGLVGNMHSSWSHHRPRWHAVLMPMVFELARDAGVCSKKLRNWSAIHASLYEEACGIAEKAGVAVAIAEDETEVSWRVFGKAIELPKRRKETSANRVAL